MTISDRDDRRNQEGLGRLRRRFINRSRTVAETIEFREAIRQARRDWNLEKTAFPVVPVATPDDLFDSPQVEPLRGCFAPSGLFETLREPRVPEFLDWERSLARLGEEFWPPRYFPRELTPIGTTPSMFVSACLFCSPLEVGGDAERFIPEFRIEPHSLPYEPSPLDKHTIARLTGEVQFLVEFIVNEMGTKLSQEERRGLLTAANDAGWRFAHSQGVRLWTEAPAKRWWYIPIYAGMNSTDLRAAESGIIEFARQVYGSKTLDRMIQELRSERLSDTQIARLLGVSSEQVALVEPQSIDNDHHPGT